jgi:hypothetical protein
MPYSLYLAWQRRGLLNLHADLQAQTLLDETSPFVSNSHRVIVKSGPFMGSESLLLARWTSHTTPTTLAQFRSIRDYFIYIISRPFSQNNSLPLFRSLHFPHYQWMYFRPY